MPKEIDILELSESIKNGERVALGKAITLVESTRPQDQSLSSQLVTECLKHSKASKRIGITGVPGVGKSTFLEAIGMHLCEKGEKVAVLAIDPSSEITGGSILGDKTRMEQLSQHENAFIRPSPSRGNLGGVGRKTLETIILCEAAGFTNIFIETVGVGQSETAVHHLADMFVLLVLASAGDELQGIKRGIMEMADLVVINKSDGAQLDLTAHAKAAYHSALHLFPAKDSEWTVGVQDVSSIEGRGIDETWNRIDSFFNHVMVNGYLGHHRKTQNLFWMNKAVEDNLVNRFYSDSKIQSKREELERQVLSGELSPFEASQKLLE
ncbi:MAG: LAO/AO transport system kinase [Bacteroidia bacterium]